MKECLFFTTIKIVYEAALPSKGSLATLLALSSS
jgi:hypothetical protein